MRVVLAAALYPTPSEPRIMGGAEVFTRQLAEGLVAAGDDVSVVRIALDGHYRREDANGVSVYFVPIRNLYPPFAPKTNPLMRMAWHVIDDRWRAPSELEAILKDVKPDVFHTHTFNGLSTDMWHVARTLGIPVVHTLHDYYLICPRCSRFKDGQVCETSCGSCRLLTTNRRERTRDLNAVTSVSHRTLAIHQQEGIFAPNLPTHVVHNVANPAISLLPPMPYEGVLKVGYIGRFAEEKGLHLLVAAAALLPAGSIELKLAGTASPEDQERLRQLAPAVSMDFLGFVSPVDFYAQVHLSVAPSTWEEPAGLVVLDALAAGRPVIGSNRGGISEGVEDGVTGWIVPPEVDALAGILKRLIDEPKLLADAEDALVDKASSRRAFSDLIDDYRKIYFDLQP